MNERHTTTESFRNVEKAIRNLEIQLVATDSKINAFQKAAKVELAKEISNRRIRGLAFTTLAVGTIVLLIDLDAGSSLAAFFAFAYLPFFHFMLGDGGKREAITGAHEVALKTKIRLTNKIKSLQASETAFYRTEAIYWRQKKGGELEEALKPVLQHQFDCTLCLTAASGDGGIDLSGSTSSGKSVLVQSKGWEGKVGTPVLREFLGSCIAIDPTALRILVGTGGFSTPAIEAAEQNEIVLCDSTDLVRFSKNILNSIKTENQTPAGRAENSPQTRSNRPSFDTRSSQPAEKKAVIAVCKFCYQRNRIKVKDRVGKVKISCGSCGRSFIRRLSDHDF